MKQGLVRLLYNFGKRFMGWTLHMIMCVLLCYPVSIHMSQLLSTGRPISSFTMSCSFTFIREGTMHAKFNSVVLFTVLYSRFQHYAKDVSKVTMQHTILEYK